MSAHIEAVAELGSILPVVVPGHNSPRPRILFVNRSYWPDAEATGQLLTDLCEALVDKFDVSVLCGQPNSNPGHSDYAPSGLQVRNSVNIHRLKHTRFCKSNRYGRLTNLLSFTMAVRRWLAKSNAFDLVVFETDPFLLPLVVAPASRKMGAPYMAYLQDIYPDIAIRLGKAKDNFATRQLRNRLAATYRSASRVIVLGESMKNELLKWGIASSQFEVIPNWVDCDRVKPTKANNAFRLQNNWDDDFVVMHSGNMGLSQNLAALIKSVDHDAFPRHARLVLIGGGADESRLKMLAASRKRSGCIQFFPYQPRESLSVSLSAADIHVVSVDQRIGGTLMPSKLYGILASGSPVLAVTTADSDLAREVTSHRVGIAATSHDPGEIASAIAALAELPSHEMHQMRTRARQLAKSNYDKAICIGRFSDLLEQSIRSSTGNCAK